MNRQTRTFIVVAIAVVAATVASYGTYRALSRIPPKPVEMPTKKAVVAAKQMPLGTLITRDSVKVVDWPAQTPLQGGFSTIDEVANRGLITSVVENEPISENKLAPKEAGAGLAPTIAAGMRAISLRVNEVIGVAGFVVPGSRVDIVTILANKANNSSAADTISRVVVSNVTVLSAGTRYDQDEARTDGKAIRSTVVTVMVSPIDADRIALAQSQGELMLTLRHPLDVEPTDPRGVRLAALYAGAGADDSAPKPAAPSGGVRRVAVAPPPPPPPPAPPVVKAYTVETIRAAKRSEETLLGGYVAR
jgi:pilus assembly protein CpaB